MTIRSRTLWTLPPGYLVPTEVQLFHTDAAEGDQPAPTPEEKFEEFERGAQDQKARALGPPKLPRGFSR